MVTIYALTCKENGKAYIGCTAAKLSKRMREHRCLLNSGKHIEAELLSDWVKYGSDAFSMLPIETLSDTATVIDKRRAELAAMERYASNGLLYNSNRTSFQPKPEVIAKGIKAASEINRTRVHSPESRIKRRLAQLGKPKNHGAKISATKQAQKLMR